MTPQELRETVEALRLHAGKAQEEADQLKDRYARALASLTTFENTGYCFWDGEAIFADRPYRVRGELIAFNNDVPAKLAEKARKVGLRHFFQAPNDQA